MIAKNETKPTMQLAAEHELAFINALFRLFKTAQYVNTTNDTYRTQADKFRQIFNRIIGEDGDITIKIVSDRIFINERLAKFDSDGMWRAREVIDRWRLMRIGGIILGQALKLEQFDKFVEYISNSNRVQSDLDTLIETLTELKIDNLTLLELPDDDRPSELSDDKRIMMRRSAQVSFFRAITVVENSMSNVAVGGEVDINRARRTIHSLIDILNEDESMLIELASIRDFDEYTYAHSANVCIYSLTIGIKLGLNRETLSSLGFAALFHDMGKVRLPQDLINKPAAFNENDWIQMQKHPILGAKTILRNMKYNLNTSRAAVVALEHHINIDFTGYPQLKYQKPTNLFSKIVSIADCFDALTSGRVYMKKPIPVDEVLRKMMYQMTVKFDAFILKLFVSIVGIYPPGTMVLLSSEELAIVERNNPENLTRPTIRIIGDRSGLFDDYSIIDLASAENDSKQIKKIIEPEKHNLDVRSLILEA
ncbi:MAG: HD domain-containing phosphohydrolase [Candidatus Zixiibacteriota bacterium]